jgi:hypothetical protein
MTRRTDGADGWAVWIPIPVTLATRTLPCGYITQTLDGRSLLTDAEFRQTFYLIRPYYSATTEELN